jgi:hypothetical protein
VNQFTSSQYSAAPQGLRHSGADRFCSTESNIPLINLEHGVLEVKLGKEIYSTDDPIAGDARIQYPLKKHYESIIDRIHLTIGQIGEVTRITNPWTMKEAHSMSAFPSIIKPGSTMLVNP